MRKETPGGDAQKVHAIGHALAEPENCLACRFAKLLLDLGFQGAEPKGVTPFPGMLSDSLGPARLGVDLVLQVGGVVTADVDLMNQAPDLVDAQPVGHRRAVLEIHPAHHLASLQPQA
ncbi:hypothetical protein RPN53_26780 [Pseudomonas putida]